jgi:hypothetical protein
VPQVHSDYILSKGNGPEFIVVFKDTATDEQIDDFARNVDNTGEWIVVLL